MHTACLGQDGKDILDHVIASFLFGPESQLRIGRPWYVYEQKHTLTCC